MPNTVVNVLQYYTGSTTGGNKSGGGGHEPRVVPFFCHLKIDIRLTKNGA